MPEPSSHRTLTLCASALGQLKYAHMDWGPLLLVHVKAPSLSTLRQCLQTGAQHWRSVNWSDQASCREELPLGVTERLHQEAVQHAAAVSEVRQELDESQERLRLVEAGKAQLVAASKYKNEQVGAVSCSCL